MSDNRRRILNLVAEQKISVEEADRLLALTEETEKSENRTPDTAPATGRKPRYIRVVVTPDTEAGSGAKSERVNIRVPLNIIRAGIKLKSLMPAETATRVNDALRSKGIDLDVRNIKDEDIEQLISALSEFEVDVQDGGQKVRVYVE